MRDDAERGEEEQDAHERRDADPQRRGADDAADGVAPADPGVEEAVRSRERDVTADGASDDRHDRQRVDLQRHDRAERRLTDRRDAR